MIKVRPDYTSLSSTPSRAPVFSQRRRHSPYMMHLPPRPQFLPKSNLVPLPVSSALPKALTCCGRITPDMLLPRGFPLAFPLCQECPSVQCLKDSLPPPLPVFAHILPKRTYGNCNPDQHPPGPSRDPQTTLPSFPQQ